MPRQEGYLPRSWAVGRRELGMSAPDAVSVIRLRSSRVRMPLDCERAAVMAAPFDGMLSHLERGGHRCYSNLTRTDTSARTSPGI
jgi:hypothetical protein